MQIFFSHPKTFAADFGDNRADQSHPGIDAYGLHITIKVLNKINQRN